MVPPGRRDRDGRAAAPFVMAAPLRKLPSGRSCYALLMSRSYIIGLPDIAHVTDPVTGTVSLACEARPSVAAAQQCVLYLPPLSPPLLTSSFD